MNVTSVDPPPHPPELLNEIEAATLKFGVLDYAPLGFCLLRHDFTVLFWNRCLENWTKLPSQKIVGSDLRQYFPNINQSKYRVRLKQVFEGGFSALFSPQLHQALIPCPLPDGKHRVQQTTVTAVPTVDIPQAGYYALVAIQDVTDLTQQVKSYQAELQDRKRAEAELQRSNAELEQFAYVASHDLSEPLRMVINFTQLLAEEYQGQLDEEADQMIHFAVDGAKRMKALITDLLTFSRVSTRGDDFEKTDLNSVFKIALDNLHVLVQESGVDITVYHLPTVQVDAGQMLQLFQNLLSNAIKYRNKNSPKVKIAVQEQQGHWLFSIEDNGIGLKQEHSERIFMIFQRLHTREEYPGTGIGLAICKKIVERHEGKIWVEAELGKGATFFFTLPKPVENQLPS